MSINEPKCPTKECVDCLHIPYCTKDTSDYVEADEEPTTCPKCGFWILGLLADGTGSACLMCGHIIKADQVHKLKPKRYLEEPW